MRRRGCLWIGVGAFAALVVLVSIVVGSAMLLSSPAVKAADLFLAGIEAGSYSEAYSRCAEPLRLELGSAADMGEAFERAGVVPTDWAFSSRERQNNVVDLEGQVTFADGGDGTVSLRLQKINGDWLVSAFSLQPGD